MEEIEIWKDIPDYEGLYQVSNFGKVKSLPRNTSKGSILKPSKTKVGYLFLKLSKNGKVKQFLVHRLVASVFLKNDNNLPYVNHKNEIKTDNRVENLEFCTQQYNCNYGTHNEKLSKAKYKPIIQLDLQNNFIRVWDSALSASKELKINRSHICDCCKGKRKTCGGYIWRYKE